MTAYCDDSVNDASRWLELKRGWGRSMASRLLPGVSLATTMLFDRGGQLSASTVHERVSYLGADTTASGVAGVASVSATRHRDDASQLGESSQSVFTVVAKCDDHDRPHVTEINARPTNTWHLTLAGVNFANLLPRVSRGEAVKPVGTTDDTADSLHLRRVDFEP